MTIKNMKKEKIAIIDPAQSSEWFIRIGYANGTGAPTASGREIFKFSRKL